MLQHRPASVLKYRAPFTSSPFHFFTNSLFHFFTASVRAALRIHATLCQPQPLHRPPRNQVFRHNLRRVFWPYFAVPNRIGINHHRRPVLALVQAP